MLPNTYMEELKGVMKHRFLKPASEKAILSMTRRLGRAFDESDLRDPEMLRMFRTPMVTGSRAILGMTWSMLRETKVGADLPPLKRVSLVTYPHPLSTDITILGAVVGNERLPEITWGEACRQWGWNERCVDAAGRAWWFFMPADSVPSDSSPLVVKDSQARPMRLWQVEYIVNSNTFVQKRKKHFKEAKMVEFADKAITVATCLQVDASFLKEMCRRIEAVREKHAKVDTWVLKKELDGILATKNYARLALIVDSLPIGTEAKDDEEEKAPVDPIYAALGLKGPPSL